MERPPAPSELDSVHGFLVVATDGPCGAVETPLYPPEGGDPDFLVVRAGGRARPRFPVVPAALVGRVDHARELVYVDLGRHELGRLPEHLPVAI